MKQERKTSGDTLNDKSDPAGFVRFLRQFNNGSGDYSKDRSELLKDYSSEDIIKNIKLQN